MASGWVLAQRATQETIDAAAWVSHHRHDPGMQSEAAQARKAVREYVCASYNNGHRPNNVEAAQRADAVIAAYHLSGNLRAVLQLLGLPEDTWPLLCG